MSLQVHGATMIPLLDVCIYDVTGRPRQVRGSLECKKKNSNLFYFSYRVLSEIPNAKIFRAVGSRWKNYLVILKFMMLILFPGNSRSRRIVAKINRLTDAAFALKLDPSHLSKIPFFYGSGKFFRTIIEIKTKRKVFWMFAKALKWYIYFNNTN